MDTPKAVVQLHCGTGLPHALYGKFAHFQADQVYATITFDYRGVGGSKPATLKGFSARLQDWAQLDMAGVLDWVCERYPNQKKIIVAHSMGGQLIGLMENHTRIDHIIMIASSTGYWRDMSAPFRWRMPPVWFVVIPLSTMLFGYANAALFRQGDNLPKDVALQWRRWCTNPAYFSEDMGTLIRPVFFAEVRCPITMFRITDDPIANEITAPKLLAYYPNAPQELRVIAPHDVGVDRIGHAGFFSGKFRDTLWQDCLRTLER